MTTILEIIFLLFLLYASYILLYSMISGGPFAAIGKNKLKDMIDLASVKKNEKVADLGAGDGRIVIELARKGAIADGFEMNPVLAQIARNKIANLNLTKSASIKTKDFWRQNFSEYSLVTVYIAPYAMKRVERKLLKELPKGARVVVNYFQFPTWKPTKSKGTAYLYIKK